jgi:hypothetical protein
MEQELEKARAAGGGGGADPAAVGKATETLREEIRRLNEELGDKDGQLLHLHSKMGTSNKRIEQTRQALQAILATGEVESAAALKINDIVRAMEDK